MTQINWNALRPVDVGAAFDAGMQHGRALKGQRIQDNALAAYAANPNDTEAVNALIAVNPRLGLGIRAEQQKEIAQTHVQDVRAKAAAGDPAALAELAGIDLNGWKTLDDQQKAQAKTNFDYLGQAALQIAQLPEAQRPAAWDAAIQQGVGMGMTNLAQYQGQYSSDRLNAVLDHAGKMEAFLKSQEPHYQAVPAGGALVNTRDPSAVSAFNAGAPHPSSTAPAQIGDQAAYDALPPGTPYIAPDGSHRVKGGAPSQGGATFP